MTPKGTILLLLWLGMTIHGQPGPATSNVLSGADLKGAEIMARVACSLCHLYPDPGLLPKSIWQKEVLPKMKFYLGIDQLDVQQTKDGAAFKASGLFPEQPKVPKENWPKIEAFYLQTAPTNLPAQPAKPEIVVGLKQFAMERPQFRRSPPLTTALAISPSENAIFMADATEQGFDVLSDAGAFVAEFKLGNIATSLRKTQTGFMIGCIGHFFPSEERRGQVIKLDVVGQRLQRKVLFSNLPRVAHLELADFNKDGREDFALSMFGFLTGRFSWFENLGEDNYSEHVLTNKAGAVQSKAHDFNGDGALDLAVLFGQDMENLLIYENDKKGNFAPPREAFRRAPSFGHAGFEVADFNKDGRMDFAVVNGDNGDYESPPKPYHGVRIYLDDGKGKYSEAYFHPLHGAFGLRSRDYDEDGDIDIAVVSFFPDYETNPRESFVYLENKGELKFTASTFRECIVGRWMTVEAGDVDSDGDIDLVLGSLIGMPTIVPPGVKEIWDKQGPSVLVLKNILRAPSP